jgi:hypothetical protein
VLRLVADPADPDRLASRLEHMPTDRRHDFDDGGATCSVLVRPRGAGAGHDHGTLIRQPPR